MIRAIMVSAALVFCANVAHADDIADRKAAMKAMSKAAKPVGAMIKGKAKFDAAKVKDAFKVIAANADLSLKLYDAKAQKGKTRAKAEVWTKRADFDAKMKALSSAAKAAGPKITTLASLKANFGGVMKNCGACHKVYRAKKK